MSDTNLAPPPPVAPPPPAPPPATPWYQGVLEGELLGHAQNKHWDMADPVKFAAAAAKAHHEAEKKIGQIGGAPADKIARIPDPNASVEEKRAFWSKLGTPAKPEEYDFKEIKFADGSPLDDETANAIRTEALANYIPKDQAAAMTKAVVKLMDQAEAKEKADYELKLAGEKDELAKNWGRNFEANKFVAQRGAQLLGVRPEEVVALEKLVGYARVMEMFRSIAERSGEARYVEGSNKPGDVMTKEQATAELGQLKNDVTWRTKYLNGDAEAKLKFDALTRIMAGA